jgi:hypothetical protein
VAVLDNVMTCGSAARARGNGAKGTRWRLQRMATLPTAVVVHGSRILACAGRGFGIRRRSVELRRAGRCSCGGWPTWWASSPEAIPADVEAGGDQRPFSLMVTDSSPLGGGSSCWRLQPHPFSLVEVHRRRSQSMAGVKTLLGDCRC